MDVTVRLPGVLRADADGQSAVRASLADGATLGDLFADLRERYPRVERRLRTEQGELRRYVNVFLDGDECRVRGGLAAPLAGVGEVFVIQSIAGG